MLLTQQVIMTRSEMMGSMMMNHNDSTQTTKHVHIDNKTNSASFVILTHDSSILGRRTTNHISPSTILYVNVDDSGSHAQLTISCTLSGTQANRLYFRNQIPSNPFALSVFLSIHHRGMCLQIPFPYTDKNRCRQKHE